MTASMTWGDALWDLSIGLTSIIFINIALYVRFKGKKAFFLYAIICLMYILIDALIFEQIKYKNWFFIFFVAFLIEFITIYLAGYMAEGDLWRNFTYVSLVQVLDGLLLGVVSFFNRDIKNLLYYDGLYRIKNAPIKTYIHMSLLQVTFAILISLMIRFVVRRINRKNYIAYKFFFAFYFIYGFINAATKAKLHTDGKYLVLYFHVFMQFIMIVLCVYLMIYVYNKSIRKDIENKLLALEESTQKLAAQYKKISDENQALSGIKSDLINYVDKAEAFDNKANKDYVDAMKKNGIIPEYSTNPLVGSLLIDSAVNKLEMELKSKNTVLELTIGCNCENLIKYHEKKIAYFIKTITTLKSEIKNNSYVVIGIRNKGRMLFVSADMACQKKLYSNREISRLTNYIRLEKGYCVIKCNEDNTLFNVLL